MLSPLPASIRETLLPGKHRPIYLWAGPGTVRMNRLKFMDAKVDKEVHLLAHTQEGAWRVVYENGCKWVYLMYNWGFPPEVEEEDWRSFEAAAAEYHRVGGLVFAYIQSSNCVYQGSFKEKDWYARDWHNRLIHYYTGRYMTCWENPEWTGYLKQRIEDAIHRGADGIFFDNPWHGARPMHLWGAWLGGAGCYCARCRENYRVAEGRDIPRVIRPGEAESDRYLRWREQRVTHRIHELAETVRTIKPDAPVSANNFDAVMRPSDVTYGIDLERLAKIQDVVMIEDYGLPHWHSEGNGVLVNNALTLRTARALCGPTPLSVDPYDRGIGFDRVFPARRYLQALGEAAACRASCVVKATEFIDEDGVFTLLTDERYTDIRLEIGEFQHWLEEHAGLLRSGRNLAQVGLLFPRKHFWHQDGDLARLYFGCGQTLLAAGIPWRTVLPGDDMEGLKTLLVFDLRDLRGLKIPGPLKVVEVNRLKGWHYRSKENLLERERLLHRAAARFVDEVVRGYFAKRWMRAWMDRAGVMNLFTGSPYFSLPGKERQVALLGEIQTGGLPTVQSVEPVLVEMWEQDGICQIHLLNYGNQPQTVKICFEKPETVEVLRYEQLAPTWKTGQELVLELDLYTILLVAG
jgi:hypothetical protein